jgi:murein DD-endopeptidase MepM/ murein hydrolase activator NlpD
MSTYPKTSKEITDKALAELPNLPSTSVSSSGKSASPSINKPIKSKSIEPNNAPNNISESGFIQISSQDPSVIYSNKFDTGITDPSTPLSSIGTLLIPAVYIRIGDVVLHNTFPPNISLTPTIVNNVSEWSLQMDTGKNPAVPIVGDPNSLSTGMNTFRLTLNPWLIDNLGQPLLPSLSGENFCVLIIGYPNTQLSRRHVFRQKSLTTSYGNDQSSTIEYYGPEWGLGRFSSLQIYSGNNTWYDGVKQIFTQMCNISGIPETKCKISFIPEKPKVNATIPLNIGPIKLTGGHNEQLNTIINGAAGCKPIWRSSSSDAVDLVVDCGEWRDTAKALAESSPLLSGGQFKLADNGLWLGPGLLETVTIEGNIADVSNNTPFTGQFCQNIEGQNFDSLDSPSKLDPLPNLTNFSACGYSVSPGKGVKSPINNDVFAVEMAKNGATWDIPVVAPFNGVIVNNSETEFGPCSSNTSKKACVRKPGQPSGQYGNFVTIKSTDTGPLSDLVWIFGGLKEGSGAKFNQRIKVGEQIGLQSNSGYPTLPTLIMSISNKSGAIPSAQAELYVKEYVQAITRICPKNSMGLDPIPNNTIALPAAPIKLDRPLNLPAPQFGEYKISAADAKILNEWAASKGYNAGDLAAFIQAESGWKFDARNSDNCVGLWQCCTKVNPWCADIWNKSLLYQLDKLDEFFSRQGCKKKILSSTYQFGPMYQCVGLPICTNKPGSANLESLFPGVCGPNANANTWCAPTNPYGGTCDGITYYGEKNRVADKRINNSTGGRPPSVAGLTNCITSSKTRAIRLINSGDNLAGGFAYVRWTEEVKLKAEFGVCPRNIFLAPLSPDGRAPQYILLSGANNEQGYIDFFIDSLTMNWDGTLRIAVTGRRGPLLAQFETPITLPMPENYEQWIRYYWAPDPETEAMAFAANGIIPVLRDGSIIANTREVSDTLNSNPNLSQDQTIRVDPVRNKGVITSNFGWRNGRMHNGIDIADNGALEIVAWGAGIVDTVDFQSGGAGNYVVLAHADGSFSKYFHLRERSPLQVGSRVAAGQVVGIMGTTGGSSGIHLHFQIHPKNVSNSGAIDPCIGWPPLCKNRGR